MHRAIIEAETTPKNESEGISMEEQNKLSQEPAPQPDFVPPVPPAPQYAPRPPVPFVSDAHEKHLLFIAAALGIALCELLLCWLPLL